MSRQVVAIVGAITMVALGACSDDTTTSDLEEKGQFANLGNSEAPNASQNSDEASFYADADKVDILYVADNSGSMCQEQAELRNRFRDFIKPLVDEGIDVQLGITTTQMTDDYPAEPIAVPGELQSKPQPLPGFDPDCIFATDGDGEPIEGDYKPVKETITLAAECAGVDPAEFAWTDEEIKCAVEGTFVEGECERVCAGGNCRIEDLIRDLELPAFPKVLRSVDFKDSSGEVDLEEFHAAFRCSALVGTRGYGIEKGLEAAVLAVSPEKTGYAPELEAADPTAPNHGLIRQDSRFVLFVLTDENDCSHDGTLVENTSCGGDVCEFALGLPPDESPLIPVARLKNELIENLAQTKGRIVDEDEVTVISFHGESSQPELPVEFDQLSDHCSSPDYEYMTPICESFLGKIGNGSRYAEFAAQFTHAYPAPQNGEVPGSLCSRDFGATFDGSVEAILRDE